jgi:hypothetical protein
VHSPCPFSVSGSGNSAVTTRRPTQPAPHDQAGCQLAVVAVGFTVRCITSRLSRIGDTPVLTIEDPAGGPNDGRQTPSVSDLDGNRLAQGLSNG